jgi:cytochrome b6-f complex iron-sulfur subunit
MNQESLMRKNISRRDFIKVTGATGATLLLVSCSIDLADKTELTFFDRVLGRPLTQLPTIEGAWSYADQTLTLDLSKLPELESLGSAVRIEGDVLSEPVLVVLGDDGNYYSFLNACPHAGRMIDPVAGSMTLECCSVGKSVFDYEGNVLSGSAEESLQIFPLTIEGDQLLITIGG